MEFFEKTHRSVPAGRFTNGPWRREINEIKLYGFVNEERTMCAETHVFSERAVFQKKADSKITN